MFQLSSSPSKPQFHTQITRNSEKLSPTVIKYTSNESNQYVFSPPLSPRSYVSDQCYFFTSPISTKNGLTRTSSDYLCLNSVERGRRCKIFKKKNSFQTQTNSSPVNPNFRIINYGPIQLTQTKKENKERKYSMRHPQDIMKFKNKVVSFKEPLETDYLREQKNEETCIHRYHDTSDGSTAVNNSEIDYTQMSEERSVGSESIKQQCGSMSINRKDPGIKGGERILNDRIMQLFENTQIRQTQLKYANKNAEVSRKCKKQIKNQIMIVWGSCAVCIAIILWLLAFT